MIRRSSSKKLKSSNFYSSNYKSSLSKRQMMYQTLEESSMLLIRKLESFRNSLKMTKLTRASLPISRKKLTRWVVEKQQRSFLLKI